MATRVFMKSLYICRHAQADDNADDMNRELTETGKAEAEATAQKMVKDRARPDIMICSPAKRALQTAAILCKHLEYPEQRLIIEPKLFEQDFETIIKYLRGLDRNLNKVMLVGHNPTTSALASWLTGKSVKLAPGAYIRIILALENWYSAIRFQAVTRHYHPSVTTKTPQPPRRGAPGKPGTPPSRGGIGRKKNTNT